MTRRFVGSTRGMTLIELLIVVAIIGMTSVMAGVYVSTGNTQLRSTLRNLRFDMERSRQEALSRNATITLDFPQDLPSMDCDENGAVDEKDICYVIYEDRDGVEGFNPSNPDPSKQDEKIKTGVLDSSIEFYESQRISFMPTGTTDRRTIKLKVAGKSDSCLTNDGETCEDTCYSLTVNYVGRIKEECVCCQE